MRPADSSPPEDAPDEIAALIATLHETERRLEELTGGEVDTVADSEGRRIVLRRAEDQIRESQADRAAALDLALERQQTELRVLFDLMPALIWFKDTNNGILRVNQRVADLAGKTVEEIEGRPSHEIYPIEAAKFYADDLEVINSGAPRLGIIESVTDAEGNERWVLTDKVPVLNKSGNVVGIVVMARDITERKLAIEAIRASEERFSTAFEHAPIGVALVSLDLRYQKVNRALCDLFGYSEAEFLDHSVQDFTHPQDHETGLESVRQVRDLEIRSLQIEKRYVHKTGRIIVGLLNISLVQDAKGKPQYFIAQIQDITERKRAENELRASNQRFHQLADHITDVFWIRSPDMRELHYVSPAFEGIWGRSVESLYANPQEWSDFIVPEDRERVLAAFSTLTRDAAHLDLEYRIVRPDGEVRWVRSRGFQVRDDHGVLIRNIGIVTDITEPKWAEIALRQSQERLRKIFDGVGPSMFVGLLTPDGVLVEVNRSSLEAAGVHSEDVLGKHFADTHWWSYSPEVQQQLHEAIVRAARGGSSRYDVRVRGAGDSVIDVDFSLQPLRNESGEVVFLIPSASVITERKQAEEALRQSQKIEAVGQLAAGVAHEFNNILQTLTGMAALTRLRAKSPEIVKIAADMEIQIRRGASITQQLLVASRHQEPTRKNLDLSEQVVKARQLLRPLLPENIEITVETSKNQASVQGDAGQIQQVLLNLAINARDAMPEGGTLALRVSCNGTEVFIDVEDDGTGFDVGIREHLFEPFFTTKEVGKGTGLGLAVVYGIIQQHGGRIEVRSQPGEGTLFRVILPQISGEPTSVGEPGIESGIAKTTGTILLVEDEEGVREGIAMLLNIMGYEVIAVNRGEVAMALPLIPAPDLLLSDVSLPGIGGPALAERLRVRWPSLRVLLMTGYVDANTRKVADNQGWHVLEKPFEIEELGRHLESAMNGTSDTAIPAASTA